MPQKGKEKGETLKSANDWFKKDVCDTCRKTIQYFIEDGLIYAYCGCDVVDSVKEFKKHCIGDYCQTCKKLNWNCICWDKKKVRA
jgi:hypothetical protein